jgi:threonine dehydrogenase-like Zn-dependent dehydrogenase
MTLEGGRMRIAVLRKPRRFEIEDAPLPVPGRDQVLVQVAGSGVCSSDLEHWTSEEPPAAPLHLGHEVSGTVVELGAEVTDLAVGDRVGVWVLSHGFAEYVAVRAEHCRRTDGALLDAALAEPLSCAANAVEAADVRLGDDVVVVGAGFMGNLVQKLAALRGPRQLIVADSRADALERAAAMGATRVVDVTREPLSEVVASLTGGAGADVSFECTGTQAALGGVGDLTRMSGTIAIVGFHQGAPREIPMGHWNWMGFTIVNAHFREETTIMRGMTVGMRLLSAGTLTVDELVTHPFGLDQVNEAFATLRDKPAGFAKAVLRIGPDPGVRPTP